MKSSILVIEDSASVRRLIEVCLRPLGVEIRSVEDGLLGLEAAKFEIPQTIVLDIGLPGMDGWETLVRLRGVSRVPIIMLTIYSAKHDIIKGLDLGADDYLVKPFGIRELIARVHAVLRRASPVHGAYS